MQSVVLVLQCSDELQQDAGKGVAAGKMVVTADDAGKVVTAGKVVVTAEHAGKEAGKVVTAEALE